MIKSLLFLLIFSSQLFAQTYIKLTDNWTKIFEKKGITTFNQPTDVHGLMAFKSHGVLHGNIINIMELLRNVDDSISWTPNLLKKTTLKDISDTAAVTFTVNDIPWPFKDREAVLMNELFLDKKNKMLTVKIHSVPFAKGIEGDNVRAHVYNSTVSLRPLDLNRTYVEMVILFDPKGAIPTWIVNFVQKNLPYNFLKALESRSKEVSLKLRPGLQKMYDDLVVLLPNKEVFLNDKIKITNSK